MSKLDRWMPFKFNRKSHEEKKQEGQAATGQTGLAPAQQMAPWPFQSSLFSAPMQQLVQGVFSDPFFREPFGRFEQLDRWFGDFSPQRFAPSVDVSEDGDALKVTAELPGMSKEDVKLQIDNDMLVISGEKKSQSENKNEGAFRTERYYGYFQRAIPLPEDGDPEGQRQADRNQELRTTQPSPSAPTSGPHRPSAADGDVVVAPLN